MSRRSSDHRSAIDAGEAMVWRTGTKPAMDDAVIFYRGTAQSDHLVGSNFDDYFDMAQGGSDRVKARGGDDVVYFGTTFDRFDRVNGGEGYNIVILDGKYAADITIGASNFKHVDLLGLNGGSFTIKGDLEAATLDATSLTKHQSLHLDVTSSRPLSVTGGTGDDVIQIASGADGSVLGGGGGDDVLISESGETEFTGGAGADHLRLGDLADKIVFNSKSDSVAAAFDTVDGYVARADGSEMQIALLFDSDDTRSGVQRNFHFGATADHLGDVTVSYDAELGQTIVSAFTDADDVPDFVLHLTGDLPLTRADFAF